MYNAKGAQINEDPTIGMIVAMQVKKPKRKGSGVPKII
jgi:hypothetical protein